MKPLGRFFQVTETLNFEKYFLDIEKIERYPITFVIKSEESVTDILLKLKEEALKSYVIHKVVEDYLKCIEEIVNIPILRDYLSELDDRNLISDVLEEIVIQTKLEFNYEDEDNN